MKKIWLLGFQNPKKLSSLTTTNVRTNTKSFVALLAVMLLGLQAVLAQKPANFDSKLEHLYPSSF